MSHADGDLASELWALSKAHSSKNGHEMARVAQPLVADTFKNCEGLSRVAFMDGNGVVMLGKVVTCEAKVEISKKK